MRHSVSAIVARFNQQGCGTGTVIVAIAVVPQRQAGDEHVARQHARARRGHMRALRQDVDDDRGLVVGAARFISGARVQVLVQRVGPNAAHGRRVAPVPRRVRRLPMR